MKKCFAIFFLVLSLGFSTTSYAQLRTKPIDKLGWYNPWIGNGNMAGLTLNKSFLGDSTGVKGLSEAKIGAVGKFGEFRNVFDPKSGIDAFLGIESFSKVNKVYLYGRFKFSYDYDKDNSWRGSIHPYSTPFMLVDPVVGDITTQFYSMEAGIGIPLGSGWSLGVDIAYDAGIMAKLKDLRNSNTDMTFKIAPGISYGNEIIDVGLSAGYERATEKVEYTQISSSKENYLYYLYGMWVYNMYGYSSAETSRFNASDRAYGSITLDLHSGHWKLYDNFEASIRQASQTENGYNNLTYGDTRSSEYRNKLLFQYNDRHRVILNTDFCSMAADRYIQQQEQDKSSGIRRWVTYGTEPCWSRNMINASISYEYRNPLVWELGGGIAFNSNTQRYVCSPISISQSFKSIEPFIQFSQYVTANGMRWEFTPALRYRIMTESVVNDVSYPSGTTIGTLQLDEPLAQEAGFLGNDTFTGSLSICCDFWRMFIWADYGILYCPTLKSCRHSIGLTVGFAF